MSPVTVDASFKPATGRVQTVDRPRIGVIGCGAIAETYHLPAIAKVRSALGAVVLSDVDESRLRRLSARFNVDDCVADYRDLAGRVDAAIVAVPPAAHHPICMDLAARGVHVMCEKPLASTACEAEEMVALAARSGVTLAVNHTRRLFPAYRRIRELIASGTIGPLTSVTYSDGQIFSWEAASAFHFRGGGSRGVLLDKGIHGLDTLCWWLGGDPPELLSAETDSFGGVEGVAMVDLRHRDCSARLHVSWLSRLSNTFRIEGELGVIQGGIEDWGDVSITYRNGRRVRLTLDATERHYTDFADALVRNFLDTVRLGARPLVEGRDVLPAMRLLDQCYRRATRFDLPWYGTVS